MTHLDLGPAGGMYFRTDLRSPLCDQLITSCALTVTRNMSTITVAVAPGTRVVGPLKSGISTCSPDSSMSVAGASPMLVSVHVSPADHATCQAAQRSLS